MIKLIGNSKKVIEFLLLLQLNLSKPQKQHVLDLMDGLITCESTKTISALNRLFLETTDQSSFSDFFTYSPWSDEQVRQSIIKFMIDIALKTHPYRLPILISIDDSMVKKPKQSKHFQTVDWCFDAKDKHQYGFGTVFVTCHLQIGNFSTPINFRLYLREKTVRKLNRKRAASEKILFKSKSTLAEEILTELKQFLPEDYPIYILFDSWYASNKLIKFCRKQSWHVICKLKYNHIFNGKRLSRIARHMRNKSFNKVWLNSPDSTTCYWVCVKKGHLENFKDEVALLISKRHNRDKRPEFFLCTDTSLSAQKTLRYYSQRWAIEVDHLYLKTRLGLGDFRLRSLEGITKYFQLVFLTLAYLCWRKSETDMPNKKSISDIIAMHRFEHFKSTLAEFGEEVLKQGKVEPLLDQFLSRLS